MEQVYCYSCHLHIHSTFSDGFGTVQEILAAAREAGVDIICLTEHNTLEPRRRGLEGWHGSTLLLVGLETGYAANHYLSFDHEQEVPNNDADPQQVIDNVNSQGGFGFLAHPFEKGTPLFMKGRHFPWNRWDIKGYTGLEVWNYASQWREVATTYPRTLYYYFFDRRTPVAYPPVEALPTWDRLCRLGPVVGLCGSDAHAVPVKVGPFALPFFPYRFLFRSMNNHLLLRSPICPGQQHAKDLVYSALKGGNLFFAFDAISSPGAFRCGAFNGKGEKILPGEKISFDKKTTLYALNPNPRGILRIIKNGELVYEKKEQTLYFHLLTPGVYRVEVYYAPPLGRPRPWIYANPVYVE